MADLDADRTLTIDFEPGRELGGGVLKIYSLGI